MSKEVRGIRGSRGGARAGILRPSSNDMQVYVAAETWKHRVKRVDGLPGLKGNLDNIWIELKSSSFFNISNSGYSQVGVAADAVFVCSLVFGSGMVYNEEKDAITSRVSQLIGNFKTLRYSLENVLRHITVTNRIQQLRETFESVEWSKLIPLTCYKSNRTNYNSRKHC
jgi:hypothetical protein